jgi:regulator of sigma E protease
MNLVFPVAIYFAVFYFQTQGLSSRVGTVDPDSAAWAAGIRPGDTIASVDGKPVSYFGELKDLIGPKYDQVVKVGITRFDGSHFDVDVTPRKITEQVLLHTEVRGVLGVGPRQPSAVIGIADPSSPAARAGLQSLDRLTKVAGQPVRRWVDAEHAIQAQTGPFDVEFLRQRDLGLPGASLTSFDLKTTHVDAAGSASGIASANGFVAEVVPGSPADLIGLRRGDQIVKANGEALAGWSSLERVRSQAKADPIDLEVLRAGAPLHVRLVQRVEMVDDDFGHQVPLYRFGASPDSTAEPADLIPVHYSPLYSLTESLRVVPKDIGAVVDMFGGLVSGKVAFKTTGSVGMLADIAIRSAEEGWDSFLSAMAMISINLGIMNLLPIPVLDGFHILAAGFEWVRRRPISLRAREMANLAGLAILLLLMVFVLRNDFLRYVPKFVHPE